MLYKFGHGDWTRTVRTKRGLTTNYILGKIGFDNDVFPYRSNGLEMDKHIRHESTFEGKRTAWNANKVVRVNRVGTTL